MYDYVVKELPKLLSENFFQLDTTRASISGHSMGGHGALTLYLKNLDKYKEYDATCLVSKFKNLSATILIDQIKPSRNIVFSAFTLSCNLVAYEQMECPCIPM